MERNSCKGYSVFFCGVFYYGGTQNAANKVKEYLEKKYPKVDIEIRENK